MNVIILNQLGTRTIGFLHKISQSEGNLELARTIFRTHKNIPQISSNKNNTSKISGWNGLTKRVQDSHHGYIFSILNSLKRKLFGHGKSGCSIQVLPCSFGFFHRKATGVGVNLLIWGGGNDVWVHPTPYPRDPGSPNVRWWARGV